MNYYPHHIGDYTRDTAHLTLAEDGAYRRMLDLYYASEKPLTGDRAALYRILRARSKDEKEAVDTVLAEFFLEREDGWHQTRCDAEIAKALEEGEESRSKKENEKERQRRHRQRRKELFEGLRAHGHVPAWDTSTDELERMLSACMSHDSNAPVTRTATANHKPITNNQDPKKNKTFVASATFARFWQAYPRKVAKPAALKAWEKLKPDDLLAERICRAVAVQSGTDQWRKDSGAFIPHPATWLNGRRWEDEISVPVAEPGLKLAV